MNKFSAKSSTAVLLFSVMSLGFSQVSFAADYKNTRSYKDAYSCGVAELKDGSPRDVGSLIATCVGNSHDPDKAEIQGFRDAISASRGKQSAVDSGITCSFAYGVYEANGSRADDFLEGAQKVTTMKMVARLWPGRQFVIYDTRGARVPDETINQWFRITKQGPYGIEEIRLTDYAKRICSKKQTG